MKKLLRLFILSATVFVVIFLISGCSSRLSADGTVNGSDVDDSPVEELPPDGNGQPETYEIAFVIDGEVVSVESYTSCDEVITEPEIPHRAGYTASWEEYTLTGENITVNAIYSAINYTINYFVDGEFLQSLVCTVENFSELEPAVPERLGYDGKWVYETDETDGDYVAVAEYALVTFTVNFYVDGRLFHSVECDVENFDVYPEIPVKEHFTAEWEEFVYTGDTVEIHAIYTPVVYSVAFVASGHVVSTAEYTLLDADITEPSVPEKPHYTGVWEEYSLSGGNLTVNAVYSPIVYVIGFYADDELVAQFDYTVEGADFEIPDVPLKDGFEASWENYELTGGNIRVNAVYVAVNFTSDLNFVRNAEGWTVGAYGGSEREIVIPPTYEGLPVTAIADEAFEGRNITKLNVLGGVRVIGNAAFMQCVYLSEVRLPESLEELGENAFSYCTALENVALPSGIKKISPYAFSRSGLTEITLPSGLRSVEVGVFYSCANLKRVVVPASVTVISKAAFAGCRELERVVFLGAVPEISDTAFKDCDKLSGKW